MFCVFCLFFVSVALSLCHIHWTPWAIWCSAVFRLCRWRAAIQILQSACCCITYRFRNTRRCEGADQTCCTTLYVHLCAQTISFSPLFWVHAHPSTTQPVLLNWGIYLSKTLIWNLIKILLRPQRQQVELESDLSHSKELLQRDYKIHC